MLNSTPKEKKADFLSKYLDHKLVNHDDLGCPRVEQLYFKNFVNCSKHLPHHNSKNHCALKKSKAFYDWLKNECQQRASGESEWRHTYLQIQFFVLG